jgi:hypothetical protein
MSEPSKEAKEAAKAEIENTCSNDTQPLGYYIQQAINAATAKLREELEKQKELREGDNKLIRALAEDAGIKITAPNHMLGSQWEQFHDGVIKLAHQQPSDECKLWGPSSRIEAAATTPEVEKAIERLLHEVLISEAAGSGFAKDIELVCKAAKARALPQQPSATTPELNLKQDNQGGDEPCPAITEHQLGSTANYVIQQSSQQESESAPKGSTPAAAATTLEKCPQCGQSDEVDGDVQNHHKWCHRCQIMFPVGVIVNSNVGELARRCAREIEEKESAHFHFDSVVGIIMRALAQAREPLVKALKLAVDIDPYGDLGNVAVIEAARAALTGTEEK